MRDQPGAAYHEALRRIRIAEEAGATALNLAQLKLSRLPPELRQLTSLQSLDVSWCDQISDLKPLEALTSLQSLDVSGCGQISDLKPLEALTSLQSLNVSMCGQISDLKPLEALTSLQSLNVSMCGQISDLKPLEALTIPVRLNLWDFGGQEIYHGSHSLFVQGRAIFLILWTPELEHAGQYEENGVPMRHRPLAYWLDYLRAFAGKDSPVLIIQSKCDTAAQRTKFLPSIHNLDSLAEPRFAQVSARTGLGLGLVRESLREAVRDCMERRPPAPIGAGRARVRSRLRELLAKDKDLPSSERQYRWLSRAQFDRLCDEEGGISDKDALLDFLHQSGVVFYRRGLFADRIVLDQNWALDAIYALFDRKKTFPVLRGHGRFNRADLETLVWQQYTREEQLVFLGMMENCGICFRVRQLELGEWEYIAPELLPAWSDAQETLLAGRLLQVAPSEEFQAEYEFLHEGLLRNYLSTIGERAGNAAIYWRYGCWFYEKTTDSRVVIESGWQDAESEAGAGSIRFRAWGPGARQLLEPLLLGLERLPIGHPPRIEWKTGRPSSGRGTPGLGGERESDVDIAGLQISTAIQPTAGQRTVYISYAWGDDSSLAARQRGQVVEQLCKSLELAGWNVVRDQRVLRSGDLITDFIKTITHADRIIAVISGKYLRSPWCMAELYGVYQRSTGEKDEFLRHVIPLTLEDARFSGWRDRVEIAKYWESEFQAMRASFDHLGAFDLALWKAMQDWHNHVGDMLAHVSDKLHPHGFDSIVANDFAALKEMLEASSAPPPQAKPRASSGR